MWRLVSGLVFGSVLIAGCADKAQPSYAACVQADTAGDVNKAWDACNAAVGADPTSTAGKAAAEKMTAMKPRYDAWKAEEAKKKDAAAAADRTARAERAKADAEARARAAASARAKIRRMYDGHDPDATCTAKGLPPFREDYTGGTLAEDQMVASADGCSPLFPGRDDPMLAITFCCPR